MNAPPVKRVRPIQSGYRVRRFALPAANTPLSPVLQMPGIGEVISDSRVPDNMPAPNLGVYAGVRLAVPFNPLTFAGVVEVIPELFVEPYREPAARAGIAGNPAQPLQVRFVEGTPPTNILGFSRVFPYPVGSASCRVGFRFTGAISGAFVDFVVAWQATSQPIYPYGPFDQASGGWQS